MYKFKKIQNFCTKKRTVNEKPKKTMRIKTNEGKQEKSKAVKPEKQ
jgi:hypothetical protein